MTIKEYTFIKLLGKGTSASVYQAYSTKTKKIVAAKQIAISKIKDTREHERFKRECLILKKLSHQNIIKLLKVDKNNTYYFLFLEYCNGCNLYEYKTFYGQKYGKQLNELYVQKILRQLIQGLEYMHTNNVIHRDIKLDNILLNFNEYPNVVDSNNKCTDVDLNKVSLNNDFTIKIADLGFAREINSGTMGTICGTPITMSPEIILNNTNKNYNSKADLWSLGAITYELLVGRVPFFATSIAELKKQIAEGKYSLPKQLKLSVEAISFINGLLQFYPDKRMTWDEIKKHPFITKNVGDFHIINLTNENQNEDNLELNSKTCDNYLWLNYKNNTFNVDIDKVGQDTMANKKIQEEVEKNKIINEDLLKAIEEEKKKLQQLKEEQEKVQQNAEKIKQQVEETIKQAEETKKKAEEEKRIASEEAERLREKTKKEIEELKRLHEIENVKIEEMERERIAKQKIEYEKFQEEKQTLLNKLKDEEEKLEQKRKENLKTKEQNELMLQNAQRLKEEAEHKVEEILKERELNQLNKEETEKYFKAEEEKRQIDLQIKEQKQKEIVAKLKEQSEELEKLKAASEELKKQLLEKNKIQQELEKKQIEKDCIIEKMKVITDEKEKQIFKIEQDKKEQEFLLLQEKQKFQLQLEEKEKDLKLNILKAQEQINKLQQEEAENEDDIGWEKFQLSFEDDFQIDELCAHYEVLNEYF